MAPADLLKIYFTVIRLAVEYCSVVYHSLIPGYVVEKLERLQKQAIKIIYGNGVDYDGMVEDGSIEALEARRTAACLRFAQKASETERFGPKWFPRNRNDREVRSSTRRVFVEKNCRRERDCNNPIQYMV